MSKKKNKTPEKSKTEKSKKDINKADLDDDNHFGLPDRDLKKNLGCGG